MRLLQELWQRTGLWEALKSAADGVAIMNKGFKKSKIEASYNATSWDLDGFMFLLSDSRSF
jgi:hypothetical protein